MRTVRFPTLAALPAIAAALVLLSPASAMAESGDDDGDGFTVSTVPALLSSNGVSFNSDRSRAYVSSAYGGITVIDTSVQRSLATMDISRDTVYPTGVGWAGGKLYVPSIRDISVVDASSGVVMKKIGVPFFAGASESQVAVAPSGDQVLVVMGCSTCLMVIDSSDDTVFGRVPIGANYNRIALSPDGTAAYLTNKETGTLLILDVSSLTIVRMLSISTSGPILDFPCSVAVSPTTNEVLVSFVTPDYMGHVAVFGPAGERRRVLDVGRFSTGIDVTDDGAMGVLGSGDVLDLENGGKLGRLPVPKNGLCVVAYSSTIDCAYVTNAGERNVAAIGGFDPTLHVHGLPRMGDTITFSLDMPADGSMPFQLAASNSSEHGFDLGNGKLFPLDRDPLFRMSRTGEGPFAGWIGTLDRDGAATVTLQISSSFPMRGVGYPISFAYATFGSTRDRSQARHVSNAVTIKVLP